MSALTVSLRGTSPGPGAVAGAPEVSSVPGAQELRLATRAMATDISLRAPDRGGDDRIESVARRSLEIFHEVERACTRFDPSSPLMRANVAPHQWHEVPPVCFAAILEASRAHASTAGRFDPRVLDDLVALGYDRTFAAVAAAGDREGRPQPPMGRHRGARPPWRPRFRGATHEVNLGGAPIDLGGIGKGLAVRWASDVLSTATSDFLLEAGGDCFAAGSSPEGGPWRIGIEDPLGGADPVAVLALRDRACTTSSVRLRHWRSAGRQVHHLIDPRTGQPGGVGLASVTVIGADPATAEVWSKALFLTGRHRIAAEATRRGLAAIWVADDGELQMSPTAKRSVSWTRP